LRALLRRRNAVLAAHPPLLSRARLLVLVGRREPRLGVTEPEGRGCDEDVGLEAAAPCEPALSPVAPDRDLRCRSCAGPGRLRPQARHHHHHRLRRSPLEPSPAVASRRGSSTPAALSAERNPQSRDVRSLPSARMGGSTTLRRRLGNRAPWLKRIYGVYWSARRAYRSTLSSHF